MLFGVTPALSRCPLSSGAATKTDVRVATACADKDGGAPHTKTKPETEAATSAALAAAVVSSQSQVCLAAPFG